MERSRRSQRSRILHGSHSSKATDTSSKLHSAIDSLRRQLSTHKTPQFFEIAPDHLNVSCTARNHTPSALLEDLYGVER